MSRHDPRKNATRISYPADTVEKIDPTAMSIVFWKNEYSMGNDEIDRQHEHIIALLNSLEVADSSGEGAATTDLVLTHLLRYLAQHFAAEEQLMANVGYPEVDSHVQQHEEFSCRLAKLISSITSGETSASECVPCIREWLHGHMLDSDQHYASWLSSEPEAIVASAKRLHRQPAQFADV
jgi:hemerythrin